ncbi:CBS domain-containing protein, partial [Flavobacterium sp. GP15]|uniref:CBS domain-containing protein n=1 Tax=Flavobacterium sp. GP15 TaxID=2758567 RepID=UPI001CB70884
DKIMTENLKVSLFIDKETNIISCELNDTISKAKTLMLLNGFSQLPILYNGKIQGCISWKSIGKIEAIDNSKKLVKQYVEKPIVVKETDNFLDYIKVIAQNDYILVIDSEEVLKAIITTYDMTLYFEDFITPYLKLGIIEDCIRKLITKIQPIDLKKDINELVYGQYKKIFEIEENWAKLGLTNLDKGTFVQKLEEIRIIRNKVAHYKPTPLTKEEHFVVKSFAAIIEQVSA